MEEKLAELIRMVMAQESNTDSICAGTPSKGGEVKVYFNADNVDAARRKIDNALMLRKEMSEKMAVV